MNVKYLAVGVASAVGGFVLGCVVTKKKCYAKADAEISSIREAYNNRLKELSDRNLHKPPLTDIPVGEEQEETESTDSSDSKGALINYARSVVNGVEATEEETANAVGRPAGVVLQTITMEEYNDASNGYLKDLYIVYEDGIVAREQDDSLVDVEETVGVEAVNHILRGYQESIYIRNVTLMCDYELVYMDKTYTEVTGIQIRE